MEFRLTYQGPLYAASNSNPGAKRKHLIRRQFHPQLKALWEKSPNLGQIVHDDLPRGSQSPSPGHKVLIAHQVTALANEFALLGYNFVPLVTKETRIWCGLEILLLTPSPQQVLAAGDLDNRIKTLFDALRMPSQQAELGGYDNPEESERPFFCLLEDDRLVSKVAVETDMLLEPVNDPPSSHDVRLVIKVTLKPTILTWDSIRFS
jgi:hypothetical protein